MPLIVSVACTIPIYLQSLSDVLPGALHYPLLNLTVCFINLFVCLALYWHIHYDCPYRVDLTKRAVITFSKAFISSETLVSFHLCFLALLERQDSGSSYVNYLDRLTS